MINLKSAIVLPIFEKGDKLKLNNYRPISLLSSISKIFEKLIKSRLCHYLDEIKFFNPCQFGFVKGGSTEKALLHFMSDVYLGINNHEKAGALFIDITKGLIR